MNSFIASLLVSDLKYFQSAQWLIDSKHAFAVRFIGESAVIYGAWFLIFLWLYGTLKKEESYKIASLSIAFTVIFAFSAYAIINLGIPAFRPWAMVVSWSQALIPHPTDNSFPSGHALFVVSMLIWMWRYQRPNWNIVVFLLLGIISLVARILGWIHYPWDIIGWIIIGSIVALLMQPLVRIFVAKTAPFFLKIAKKMRL